jgi:hypothetical protein
MLFAKTVRSIQKPLPLQLFGEQIQFVDGARYLGVFLDKELTWSKYIDRVGEEAAPRLGKLVPLLNTRSCLSIRNGVLL